MFKIDALEVKEYPFHVNPNIRVVFVYSGEISIQYTMGDVAYRAGEVEIINSNEAVRFFSKDESARLILIEVGMDLVRKYCPNAGTIQLNCKFTHFFPNTADSAKQELLKEQIMKILPLYVKYGGNVEANIETEIGELCSIMIDEFNDVNNLLSDQSLSDEQTARFLRIHTYILDHFTSKISLKKIAENEYVSVQYLSAEFNRKMKQNFQSIVDYYRIMESVRLLVSTDLCVTKIAENCGFSAIRYFYKQFGHYMGCTPPVFREIVRNQKKSIHHLSLSNSLPEIESSLGRGTPIEKCCLKFYVFSQEDNLGNAIEKELSNFPYPCTVSRCDSNDPADTCEEICSCDMILLCGDAEYIRHVYETPAAKKVPLDRETVCIILVQKEDTTSEKEDFPAGNERTFLFRVKQMVDQEQAQLYQLKLILNALEFGMLARIERASSS